MQITVSLGTAGAADVPAIADEMIALADAACYLAKRAGRNRVADGTRLPDEEFALRPERS